MDDYMQDWQDYQDGIEYKQRLNLFNTVNRNERFYAGHHWDGVDTGGLPAIVLNLVKRVANYKIAQVMSDMLTMQFSADSASNYDPNNPDASDQLQEIAQLLTDYAKTTGERLKQDSINEQGLLDACLSGDAIVYFYWNDKLDVGNGVKGDIAEELIDNVNYFPGDTSEPRPNDENGPLQPYIIIAFRRLVKAVRQEATENGVPEDALSEIVADDEYTYQAGDRARDEAAGAKDKGRCTMLLRMWPGDNGTILARKSVKGLVIRPDWDTGLHRYPVAVMNWQLRKNSCHGEPEATELVPTNVAINKLMAACVLWTMLNAYPKPIYDSTRIQEWTNDITKAVPVEGDISGAAQYLQASRGGLPSGVMNLFNLLVQTAKDMAGANETALGDDSVTKTAAGIIALQKATTLPMSTIKRRFAQFNEDIGLIWREFWMTYYRKPAETPDAADRLLKVERDDEVQYVPFDAAPYANVNFSLKIDVGASAEWSEIVSIQTLGNWLEMQLITFRQYLERIQRYHLVPDVEKLMDELDEKDENKQLLYMLMARFVESLPPDVKAELEVYQQKEPEKYEQIIKQMITGELTNGGNPNDVQNMQPAADGSQQPV